MQQAAAGRMEFLPVLQHTSIVGKNGQEEAAGAEAGAREPAVEHRTVQKSARALSTHYHLLGVDPAAPSDEIKQAFRREIARYHQDKVQHLGEEFQRLAATRAAELTEAYRVLMDAELRGKYDNVLEVGVAGQ